MCVRTKAAVAKGGCGFSLDTLKRVAIGVGKKGVVDATGL